VTGILFLERDHLLALLTESRDAQRDDVAGQRWSATRYPGGYTSYGSLCRMHTLSPTFAALERKLRRHVQSFARALELDLEGRELAMTDCWINVMPRLVVHSLHLHPLSLISGTYYLATPPGSAVEVQVSPRSRDTVKPPPAATTWTVSPSTARSATAPSVDLQVRKRSCDTCRLVAVPT